MSYRNQQAVESPAVTINKTVASLPSTVVKGQLTSLIGGNIGVNLLKNVGECESLSDWTWTGWTTRSIDTDIKRFGTGSIKILPIGNDNIMQRQIPTVNGRYYLMSLHYLAYSTNNDNTTAGVRTAPWVGFNDAKTATSDAFYNGRMWEFLRTGFKFQATADNMYFGITRGGTAAYNAYWIDGIMLSEITSTEYANLSVAQLLDTYPYVSDIKPVGYWRTLITRKNLFDKVGTVDQIIRVMGGSTYAYKSAVDNRNCLVLIGSGVSLDKDLGLRFKPDTQYTFSTYGKMASINGILFMVWYTDGTIGSWYPYSSTSWALSSFTSAAGKSISYMSISYQNGGVKVFLDLDTFQIEEGTSVTTYEVFKASSTIFNDVLYGISSTARDTFEPNGGIHTKNISDTIVFSGNNYSNTTFNMIDGVGYKRIYTDAIFSDIIDGSAGSVLKCIDYNNSSISNYQLTGTEYIAVGMDNRIYLNIANTRTGWLEGWVAGTTFTGMTWNGLVKAYLNGWKLTTANTNVASCVWTGIASGTTQSGASGYSTVTTTLDTGYQPHRFWYQLAKGITTTHDTDGLIAEPSGTIINSGYIQETKTYTTVITIGNSSYPIYMLEYVNKINSDDTLTPISLTNCTVASNGLSFSITGAVADEIYDYGYNHLITTTPSLTYAYNLNIPAQVADNTYMINDIRKQIEKEGTEYVNINGDTMKGALNISTAYPQLALNNPSSGGGIVVDLLDAGIKRTGIGQFTNASSFQIATGGTDAAGTSRITRLTIDSAGKVGIGTTSPSALLTVAGATGLLLNDFNTNTGLRLNYGNSTGQISAINFIANGVDNGYIGIQMVDGTAGDLWLGGYNGRTMTLYRNGNVGISTVTPTQKFEVKGDVSGLPATSGTTQTNGLVRIGHSNSGNVLDIGINGTNCVWLEAVAKGDLTASYPLVLNSRGGNVGIGMSGPAFPLDVSYSGGGKAIRSRQTDTVSEAVVLIQAGDGTTSSRYAYTSFRSNETTEQRWDIGLYGEKSFVIRDTTNSASRIYINPTGNIGINTTTPQVKLVVTGASAAQGDSVGIFYVTDGTGANTDHKLQFGIVSNSYAWIQSTKPGTDLKPLILNPAGGNVGIGAVTAPVAKFHIKSSTGAASYIIIDTTDTSGSGHCAYLALYNNGSQKAWIGYGETGTSDIGIQNQDTTGDVWISTNSIERFRIDHGGNIYIPGLMVSTIEYSKTFTVGVYSWLKVCTLTAVPQQLTIKGTINSQASEDAFTIDIMTAYVTDKTIINVTRTGYNPHIGMVRVEGADGGTKSIYLRIPTDTYAPTIYWRILNARTDITIDNSITTPVGATYKELSIDGFISNSTTGNIHTTGSVGIGTTTPGTKLDVAGYIRSTYNTSSSATFAANQSIRLDSNVNTGMAIGIPSTGSIVAGYYIAAGVNSYAGGVEYNGTDGSLRLLSNSATRVLVDSAGKVGIGTTTPNRPLEISGGGAPALRLTNGGSNCAIEMQGSASKTNFLIGVQYNVDNALEITPSTAVGGFTFSTPAIVVKPNGFIGIGTTTPGGMLHIKSPAATSNVLHIDTTDTSGGGHTAYISIKNNGTEKAWLGYGSSASNYLSFYNLDASAGIIFATNSSERMSIDSAGAVYVGVLSQCQSALLNVNGSIASRNSGVDGTFANVFIGQYTGNNNENNAIQSSVSSTASNSGFRIQASNGGGLSTRTTVADFMRNDTILYSNGTETLRVRNGKIGLCNVIPTDQLHLQATGATIRIADNNATAASRAPTIIFDQTQSDGHGLWRIRVTDSAELFRIDRNTAVGGDFSTISTPMVIDSAGKVGIGTTSPNEMLHVATTGAVNSRVHISVNNSSAEPALRLTNNIGTSYVFMPANTNAIGFYVGSEKMRIESGGNVGIGTNAPTNRLDVRLTTTNGHGGIVNIKEILNITTTGTYYTNSLEIDNSDYTLPVGITNSGYMNAIRAEAYSSTAAFAGTLAQQRGIWARSGLSVAATTAVVTNSMAVHAEVINNASGATITNAYGVYIENTGTSGTITNRYDLYASSASAKNYFAGTVGIGTIPAYKFHVLQSTAGSTNIVGFFHNSDYTAGNRTAIAVRQNSTSGSHYSAYLGVDRDSNSIFLSNDAMTSNHLTVSTVGFVGMGTLSPSADLHIEKTGNTVVKALIKNPKLASAGGGGSHAILALSADNDTIQFGIDMWGVAAGTAACNMGTTTNHDLNINAYNGTGITIKASTDSATCNVSIGTTPATRDRLRVDNSIADLGSNTTRAGYFTNNATVTTAGSFSSTVFGVVGSISGAYAATGVTTSGVYAAGAFYSAISSASNAGSNNFRYGITVSSGISTASAGTWIGDAIGVQAIVYNGSANGEIQRGIGVYISNNGTTGIMGERYDLYAASSNAVSYFAGTVGIKTTTPSETLYVAGNVGASGVALGSCTYDTTYFVDFTNGVANQKADIYFSSFWGSLELELSSNFNNANAAGVIKKQFALGLNPSNSIYTNSAAYTEIQGPIGDHFAISDVTWDATNSRYRIQIVHRTSQGNSIYVKARAIAAGATSFSTIKASAISSVYTTDTTAFTRPVTNFVEDITVANNLVYHAANSYKSGKLSVYKSSKDSNKIFTVMTYKRPDGTNYMIATLSGGTSPNYTTRTEVYYAANGSTVLDTYTYTLSYDSDGDVTSEVVA